MTSSGVDLRGAFSIATVAFSYPFRLPDGEECRPGVYEIESEEGPAEEWHLIWRRPRTRIRLPGQIRSIGTRLVPIDLVWLRQALSIDQRKGLPRDVATLYRIS